MINKVESCPICFSKESINIVTANMEQISRYNEYSEKKYNALITPWLSELNLAIDRCLECDHYWYKEQPDTQMLKQMYACGIPLKPGTVKSREATKGMLREMARLKRLSGKRTPTLLDFGSGFGRWARAATQSGFSVTAYEPSAERGNEVLDIEFNLVHSLDELKGQSFDFINIEQVMEHVTAPRTVLNDVVKFAHEQTIIRITVPNILRPDEGEQIWSTWPFDGKRAHTMAPFEHLHGFTPCSLERLIKEAGLQRLTGFSVIRNYPKEMLRVALKPFLPKIGQTLILAKLR